MLSPLYEQVIKPPKPRERTFVPVPSVDVTPATTGSWQDVDVSSYIPSGATGAILHLEGTALAEDFGLRKKGSTDNHLKEMYGNSWALIGVDGDRKFQAYIGAHHTIYLVGYTKIGVTFFTNGYDKTPICDQTWREVDLSTECPGAIGVILQYFSRYNTSQYGIRKHGSTDDRRDEAIYMGQWGLIIGCDENQHVDFWGKEDNVPTLFLVGYITDGATFKTNADDISLVATGAWTEIDLSSEAPDAGMVFVQVHGQQGQNFGLRKDGSTEVDADIYHSNQMPFGVIEASAETKIEGKIQSIYVDFFLVGYS